MMDTFKQLGLPHGRGVCYSGFREGQRPGESAPGYDEVKEDLLLLQPHWDYLRMYDCGIHARTVVDVIVREKLDFKLMLGADIAAEMNNHGCPWDGGVYSEEELARNRTRNREKIDELIGLANAHTEIIFALSVGNETCVDWTDHAVHEERVLEYARQVKARAAQPVTFCENYVPWLGKLRKLAAALDFISVHTYPVWEYKCIAEALDYTKENYAAVARKYPRKAVVITEAGWTTRSNGRGIEPGNANETNQKIYFEKLMLWAEKEGILTFFFEAFDEPWKGSPDPLEPEKHWGLFKLDRTPKAAMRGRLRTPLPSV
ncbi:MAG: hypothetical protein JJU00_09055 [Opitutales bacterium]|nr:hypothetical protein [Opitutales bacterium]